MSGLPSGTVTFLFTDIEGSTKLWEQHFRVMQAAVARHDTLLREVIERNDGHVFKTVGDAFCATFGTAPQALDAALTAQRVLRDADWESLGIAPLKVRMALHTGVAEVRDNDYFGLPLNRVARLLSTGHGGQILLSLATQQLVRDYLHAGITLKDLGEGGLKDLARSEHVYQVVAPDLPSDFPPLKSLDTQYIEPGEDGLVRTAHNPYKGLRAFQEADAADFFGRELLTERLLGRMAEEGPLCSFLAVVGPSGSGKSSVVRAGLVPALRQGKLAGSERWLVVEMIPGAHPLEELEALLLSIAVNPPESLINQLREDERGLLRAVKRVLPRDESVGLVLVIDQFEEVFTLVEEEPARVHFLESLHAAVTDPRSRLRAVITLRADFFDRPLLYPDPGELMRQRTAVVLPLSAEELERAIVEPARHAGVGLEPELLATIIKDVGEQLGALPLLQYALTELFERRTGKVMTVAAYHESGGVLGALARRADEIYEGLSEEEREAARQLFLRMVTLGEGVEDTRRRVRRSELQSLSGDTQAQDRVITTYGKYRLLTFDMDPVTKGPTVEVAHEALIRTWGRLQEWLEECRDDLRMQRQLLTASAEWAASGKDRSFLATGARLSHFVSLTEGSAKPGGVSLTAEEREYLRASVEEGERQEKLERVRQAKELELQKRAASRLKVLVAGLAVFLVIAAGLTIWAFSQSQVAQANADEANSQRQQAQRSEATVQANLLRSEAQLLAAEADSLLKSGTSPETAALLSLRSLRTLYTPEGDAALGRALGLRFPRLQLAASGGAGATWAAAFSPDGKYLLTGSEDSTVMLWDVSTGIKIHEFPRHTAEVTSVAFSPDGKWALSSSRDKTIALWDVQSGNKLREFLGHTDFVTDAIFSPDGKWVLSSSRDNTARLWDAETGKEVREFLGHTDYVYGVAFSSDGK
jgi:class 3 adenylate cyclase